jgi:hypothetical protein
MQRNPGRLDLYDPDREKRHSGEFALQQFQELLTKHEQFEQDQGVLIFLNCIEIGGFWP